MHFVVIPFTDKNDLKGVPIDAVDDPVFSNIRPPVDGCLALEQRRIRRCWVYQESLDFCVNLTELLWRQLIEKFSGPLG